MKKLRIIVDMDCILVDLFTDMLKVIGQEHGLQATVEDLTQWDMAKCPPLDKMNPKDLYGIFRRPNFFRTLPPLPGALKAFKKLHDSGHQLVIVSTPSGPGSAADKYSWLAEHMPYLSERDVFLGSHKHMVKADVIIDDRGETLEAYNREWPQALCLGIGYPYNRYLPQTPGGAIVICGSYQDTEAAWAEIIGAIEALAKE